MKILMVANARATHSQRWSRALADRGHEVVVASVRDAEIDDVDVRPLLDGPRTSTAQLVIGYLRLPQHVASLVREFRPSVIHAHYASTNGYAVARANTAATVLTTWGSDVVPKPGKDLLPPLQRLRARRAVSHADAVTAASPFLAGHVKSLVPEVEVEIVPFGVDTRLFAPGPTPSGSTVLVAKALEQRYGIEYVIDAIGIVADVVPEAELWIAGGGSRRSYLEAYARRLGAPVRFLGPVPNNEIADLMRQSRVVVNPTVVDESFGVVLLEAQSVGRAIVSTDVGAVGDVVRVDETALLVPPREPAAMAEALIRVLSGDALANAGSIGPRFVADGYSWQGSVDAMESILVQVAT